MTVQEMASKGGAARMASLSAKARTAFATAGAKARNASLSAKRRKEIATLASRSRKIFQAA